MKAADSAHRCGRGVHEVGAGAAVDVYVEEAGRDVPSAGVDYFRAGRNFDPLTHRNNRSVVEQHAAGTWLKTR